MRTPFRSVASLKRNCAGNLQRVSLEGRFALELVKIFDTDARLAVREDCVNSKPKTVDFIVRCRLFGRYRWAILVCCLPLPVAHQANLKSQAFFDWKGLREG